MIPLKQCVNLTNKVKQVRAVIKAKATLCVRYCSGFQMIAQSTSIYQINTERIGSAKLFPVDNPTSMNRPWFNGNRKKKNRPNRVGLKRIQVNFAMFMCVEDIVKQKLIHRNIISLEQIML